MTRLSLDRIFGSPDLAGSSPVDVKFSPDGESITFLRSSTADAEFLNLWQYSISQDTARELVDAGELRLQPRSLSDEEKARRERKRISQSGIVEYIWSPTGTALVFPLEGNLYLYRPGDELPLQQLTDDTTFETDIQFSHDGRYLSFIRDKNLFVIDLDTFTTMQLTEDGGGTVSNGLAEFIAQEEMHRFSGYWWSPDNRHIAYLQVDESAVPLSQRFEIDADDFSIFDQRYPFAGSHNAEVRLGIVTVEDKRTRWIELERDDDSYIARINWLANNLEVAVQVQSRNQQELHLFLCEIETGERTRVVTETSDTWINLHDVFHCLPDSSRFIWASERSGYRHLYLLERNGTFVRQLTQGEWQVADLHGVDEDANAIYFSGYRDSPLERHLYRVRLDKPAKPERLTPAGTSHHVDVDRRCRYFIDRYSAPGQPPAVVIRRIDGELAHALAPNRIEKGHPFYAYRPCLANVKFGELGAEDGQRLFYRLIEPAERAAGRQYPVIVTVYGGPGVQRVTRQWVPPWHHYMASRGYALLQLDNRGSSNRGKAFEAPLYGMLGEVETADQLIGVNFLKTLDWVDSTRIGVFGHSYGGYMTLMMMTKAPGVFRAGVSVAPVTDWRLYDTHYTERYLGHPGENRQGYQQSAVFAHLEGLSGKLLVIHGMADDNVLFTHSTKLFRALQDANIPFEMMTYPGAKHGLSGRAVNLHRFGTMDRFFDRYLKGGQHD